MAATDLSEQVLPPKANPAANADAGKGSSLDGLRDRGARHVEQLSGLLHSYERVAMPGACELLAYDASDQSLQRGHDGRRRQRGSELAFEVDHESTLENRAPLSKRWKSSV